MRRFLSPDEESGNLIGGCAGIQSASLEDPAELESLFPDLPPDRIEHDDQGKTRHIFDSSNRAPHRRQVIQLSQLSGIGYVGQFIIPHDTWKEYGDPEARPGEYRYVHVSEGTIEWTSFRHWMGEFVMELEAEANFHRAATGR